MTDPAAWDGYPQERGADGWHWISRDDPEGNEVCPAYWDAAGADWDHPWRADCISPAEMAPRGWRYLGPCALPGEDRAAWLAGWKAAREGAATLLSALVHEKLEAGAYPTAEVVSQARTAIRAMEPPKQETKG